MLDLRQLAHALAIRDLRSFRAAARAVHLSQPALTRSIQNLESSLGMQLFDRSRRMVIPTEFGLLFLEKAENLIRAASELETEFTDSPSDRGGMITLGGGPYAAEMLFHDAVNRFAVGFPRYRIALAHSDWMQSIEELRRRTLDLCVAETSQMPRTPDVEVKMLNPHQGYFAMRAGHPLASVRRVDLKAILACPVVGPSRLPPRIMEPLFAEAGSSGSHPVVFPTIVCNQLSTMRGIVAGSDTIGMFPLSTIASQLESGEFCLAPLAPEWLRTSFGILYLRDRPLTDAMQMLMTEINRADRAVSKVEQRLKARHFRRGRSAAVSARRR